VAVVDLTREGEVFVLRMAEGENRFNRTSIDALHGALDTVEASDGPASLVVTGEGKFFSNGLDLDWMGTEEGRADKVFFGELHRLFGRILSFPMTTVAAINGHAFAAGAMLVTAHDKRVMRSDRGYWCTNEVDLGLPLTPGMSALLAARLPTMTAHQAIATGHRFPADEALAKGIVDGIAPEDEVLPRAIEIAADLASKRGEIMRTLKHGLHGPTIDLLLAGGQG
jgi:enoyl-CoA hydratase/carnithine racemase